MLGSGARTRRLVATMAVIGALVVGTFWGQDDHFPFGPFRMYSVRNELDGRIRGARVELETASGEGRELPINPGDFGLRRAEVEGQVDRFEADPELLGALAGAYETFNPEDAPVSELSLFYQVTLLRRGRPSGPVGVEPIGTWVRP
jgi:hypothetical protein